MRHGSTLLNDPVTPRVRGWVDSVLSPKGRSEAKATAGKLKEYEPQYAVSSDFMRDSETANIVCDELNISNKETDFDARTWDVGLFSGKTEAEVNPAIIEIYKRPWESCPGASESFNGFSERWLKFLDNKMTMACVEGFRPTLIITHGRNIALTQSYIEGTDPWMCDMPFPAGIALLSVEADKKLSLTFPEETEKVFQDV